MTGLLDAAVRENADWCDLVCRSHGVHGEARGGVWASGLRTPMLYPDAITLDPGSSPEQVLGRIDTSHGCAVKDSHADLDLSRHGFEVLLEGLWLAWPEVRDADPAWQPVTGADELAAWADAWSGPAGVLGPTLLADPSVTVLARYDGAAPVAGLIGHRSAGVVGLSNVFGLASAPGWTAAVGALQSVVPGLPVVGYDSGSDLDLALAAGATELGPVRVWLS